MAVKYGQIIRYKHHGQDVFVDAELMGTHREHCLCFRCKKFVPNTNRNCPIAQELYEFDVKHGVTTPVFECPVMDEGEPDLSNME